MGAATRLHAGVHPHGTWGAVGAAAGVARLRRLDAATTAAAIDAAAGLAFATTFSSALNGRSGVDVGDGAVVRTAVRPPAGGDLQVGPPAVFDPTRLALALLGAGHRAGLPPWRA